MRDETSIQRIILRENERGFKVNKGTRETKEGKLRLEKTAKTLAQHYQTQLTPKTSCYDRLPDKDAVYALLDALFMLTFPNGSERRWLRIGEPYLDTFLNSFYGDVSEQIEFAISYGGSGELPVYRKQAQDKALSFIEKIPETIRLLSEDAEAELAGDPAAESIEEIVLSYPGLYAIFVYRYAHILYRLRIPFIPRMMSEYAHSKTGIDINPGAEIGRSFFIDHGTGIVIGETTKIGDNVKLYQGVTLGALSTRKGQELSGVKRHPTIEDNVVIYANATVLGGGTVIGKNSVIAGNSFIVESVPENTKAASTLPEVKLIRNEKRKKEAQTA